MNLSMIKQAFELRSKLEKTQKELGKMKVESESDNGAVKVTANGRQKILSIKISADFIDPSKPERLEKLVLQAVTRAMDASKKLADKHLSDLTGGIKIPGITD
ncbi:MAG: YbaB/EbfC family nucleoid-associated protein [Dehalococcoidia bacterium]|nr:MAG: YbaB/EbfC family nucleoid-associated protein [Dehalococcoidia bacterium]